MAEKLTPQGLVVGLIVEPQEPKKTETETKVEEPKRRGRPKTNQ